MKHEPFPETTEEPKASYTACARVFAAMLLLGALFWWGVVELVS